MPCAARGGRVRSFNGRQGWQMRARTTVEHLSDYIDVREFYRAGLLDRPCVAKWSSFRWPKIELMRTDSSLIYIELRNQVTPQFINVSWTYCHFGGYRPWIHCPHCKRRVARLFKGLAGYFCRACVGDPPYESQLRNDKARAYLRAYRLRERLGGSRPVVDPIPARPYRMWRRTYNRIYAEIERLERPLRGSRVVKRGPLLIRPLC
jgi:hypothetical protein